MLEALRKYKGQVVNLRLVCNPRHPQNLLAIKQATSKSDIAERGCAPLRMSHVKSNESTVCRGALLGMQPSSDEGFGIELLMEPLWFYGKERPGTHRSDTAHAVS